jgi:hypothetical protein
MRADLARRFQKANPAVERPICCFHFCCFLSLIGGSHNIAENLDCQLPAQGGIWIRKISANKLARFANTAKVMAQGLIWRRSGGSHFAAFNRW